MTVAMQDIKKLRAHTGAGFAACKEALEKSSNNFDEAVTYLKKIGAAEVAKRRGRTTSEGSIFARIEGNKAVLLELCCETDFVARNKSFLALGEELLTHILQKEITELSAELKEKVEACAATIKENMEIRRFTVIEKKSSEIFASYLHGTPARLGTVVTLEGLSSEKTAKFAHNAALHAAAKLPLFLNEESVDSKYKESQMQIFREQARQLGKPEAITEKIAEGKWKKLLTEICFLAQPWVFDEKSTTTRELEKVQKETGAALAISAFTIYSLGSE